MVALGQSTSNYLEHFPPIVSLYCYYEDDHNVNRTVSSNASNTIHVDDLVDEFLPSHLSRRTNEIPFI